MSLRLRLRGTMAWIALFGCTSASAAEPTVLTPSSNWVVDYADNKCRLARVFGEGSGRAILFFEQGSPGSSFGITAAGLNIKSFRNDRPTLVRVNEALDERETDPFKGSVDGVGQALIYSSLQFGYLVTGEKERDETENDAPQAGLPSLDLENAAKADFIEFRQARNRIRFDTGNMRAPIAALDKCSADLVRAWGLDLDRHLTAMRMPVWTNRKEVARRIVAHYPGQALMRGTQGIISMRVMLDTEGMVTDCQLERTTKSESLESSACQEMKRARFDPALDREGKAMESFYATRIVYKIAP